ncbi:unnamed protein product [Amoebophrya sp. A120]|nr:unnamed protein product [Amoebophrya sp. A120]|eukprot:GSA120T00008416001.1
MLRRSVHAQKLLLLQGGTANYILSFESQLMTARAVDVAEIVEKPVTTTSEIQFDAEFTDAVVDGEQDEDHHEKNTMAAASAVLDLNQPEEKEAAWDVTYREFNSGTTRTLTEDERLAFFAPPSEDDKEPGVRVSSSSSGSGDFARISNATMECADKEAQAKWCACKTKTSNFDDHGSGECLLDPNVVPIVDLQLLHGTPGRCWGPTNCVTNCWGFCMTNCASASQKNADLG